MGHAGSNPHRAHHGGTSKCPADRAWVMSLFRGGGSPSPPEEPTPELDLKTATRKLRRPPCISLILREPNEPHPCGQLLCNLFGFKSLSRRRREPSGRSVIGWSSFQVRSSAPFVSGIVAVLLWQTRLAVGRCGAHACRVFDGKVVDQCRNAGLLIQPAQGRQSALSG